MRCALFGCLKPAASPTARLTIRGRTPTPIQSVEHEGQSKGVRNELRKSWIDWHSRGRKRSAFNRHSARPNCAEGTPWRIERRGVGYRAMGERRGVYRICTAPEEPIPSSIIAHAVTKITILQLIQASVVAAPQSQRQFNRNGHARHAIPTPFNCAFAIDECSRLILNCPLKPSRRDNWPSRPSAIVEKLKCFCPFSAIAASAPDSCARHVLWCCRRSAGEFWSGRRLP